MKRILGLFALSIFGCCVDDHRAASNVDSWFTQDYPMGEEHPESLRTKWKRLDENRFQAIEASRELEAEQMLADVSCRELTGEEAGRFLGKAFEASPGGKSYLVRGVYLNRGNGNFSIYAKDDDLFVDHGSLGHHAVPMKRQCLVIFLEQAPKRVFVTCHMAE